MIPHGGPYEGERHQRDTERERESTHVPASLLLIWLWGLSHGSELLPVHVASFWTRTPGMSCRDSPQITINPHRPGLDMSLTACIVRSPEACKEKSTRRPACYSDLQHMDTNLRRASFMSLPPCVLLGLAQGIYSWQCTWQWPIQAIPYRSDIAAIPLKQQVIAKDHNLYADLQLAKSKVVNLRSQSFAALIKVVVANDVWMIQRAQEPEETWRRLRRISGNAYSASPVSSRLRVCVCLSCLLHHVVTLPFGFSPMCLIPNAQVNRVR